MLRENCTTSQEGGAGSFELFIFAFSSRELEWNAAGIGNACIPPLYPKKMREMLFPSLAPCPLSVPSPGFDQHIYAITHLGLKSNLLKWSKGIRNHQEAKNTALTCGRWDTRQLHSKILQLNFQSFQRPLYRCAGPGGRAFIKRKEAGPGLGYSRGISSSDPVVATDLAARASLRVL